MNRRTFVKAVSAFLAVAAVAPKLAFSQPKINWKEWNNIKLKVTKSKIVTLYVNNKDYTNDAEVRSDVSKFIYLNKNEELCYGQSDCGIRFVIPEYMKDDYITGFSLCVPEMPKTFGMDDIFYNDNQGNLVGGMSSLYGG